jgi:hypothetical protein
MPKEGSAAVKVETKVEKIAAPPTPKTEKTEKSEKTERKKHRGSEKKQPEQATPPTPKAEVTKEAAIAKYRQAKAAYEAYKGKNGGRYDADWNELATYQQYHPNDLEGFVQRIESFRAKLRE